MFKPDGETLSPKNVLRALAARTGFRGDSEVVVERDPEGNPCSARHIVHRGGAIHKSWVPLLGNEEVVASEGWEKLAARTLRVLPYVLGFASQPLILRAEAGPFAGTWIPDYGVMLRPNTFVLLEVKSVQRFTQDKRERLRAYFARARAHGFLPVLWTDAWLKKNALVSNLAFLYRYRDDPVDQASFEALHELLGAGEGISLSDLAPHTDLLHCVYVLLAQGRLHTDLRRPFSASTVIRNAFKDTDNNYGKAELFAGPELSP